VATIPISGIVGVHHDRLEEGIDRGAQRGGGGDGGVRVSRVACGGNCRLGSVEGRPKGVFIRVTSRDKPCEPRLRFGDDAAAAGCGRGGAGQIGVAPSGIQRARPRGRGDQAAGRRGDGRAHCVARNALLPQVVREAIGHERLKLDQRRVVVEHQIGTLRSQAGE